MPTRELPTQALAVMLAVALFTTVAMATGCSGVHSSATSGQASQSFLADLHETATDIGQYNSDTQLVRLGRAVCDGYRANATSQQVADLMERTGGSNLPPEDLGAIISSAVKELCPAYAGRLNPVQP